MNQVTCSPKQQSPLLPVAATPSSSTETLVTVPAEPTLIVDLCTVPLVKFIAAPGPKVWAWAPVAANPQANPASRPIRIVNETILFTFIAAAPSTTHTCSAYADQVSCRSRSVHHERATRGPKPPRSGLDAC
jgi:hypothetical protein